MCFSYAQQIVTDSSLQPQQLIDNLTDGSCVIASNANSAINGSVNGIPSYALFDRGTSDFPLESGIILSTGNVNSSGNNIIAESLSDGNLDWDTDPDIEAILGISQTLNATSLEFDFTSINNSVGFKYVFASDEYQQQYPCNFQDVFAILIKEAGTSDPYVNIALVPDSASSINTSSIHPQIPEGCDAENVNFFEGYNLGTTNYDGQTIVLNATADITPGVTYRVKFVIADHIDQRFDSAVFIESEGFGTSVDLGPDITACGSTIELNGEIDNDDATYAWFIDGVEIAGETNPTLQALQSGFYEVVVTIPLPNGSCIITDSITVDTIPFQQAEPIADLIICDELPFDGFAIFDLTIKTEEILSNLPSDDFNISYHHSEVDALDNLNPIVGDYENTELSETLYARIESMDGSCLQIGSFNVEIGAQPNYNIIPPIILCADFLIDGVGYLELSYYAFEIANYEFNRTVTFHVTEADAYNDVDPITFASDMPFGSNFTYVRIENDFTSCISVVPIPLVIQERLDFDQRFYIDLCLPTSQSFAVFDLGIIRDQVLVAYPDAGITFYTDFQNAQDQAFPIFPGVTYQNEVPYQQTVYMAILDGSQDCPSVVPIELHTNLTHNLYGDQPVVSGCDDPSNDGTLDFDLNEVSEELNDGYDIEITYYETPQDRINGENPINVNAPYTVTNNNNIVYANISSNGCDYDADIELDVLPLPELEPQTIEYCGNTNAQTGLTTIQLNPLIDLINNDQAEFTTIEFYATEADAIADENVLGFSYDSASNSPLLYIRITDNRSQCYNFSTLQVNISDGLEIATPEPIIVCDDDQDGSSTVNLESVLPQLSNDLSGTTISFHQTYGNAVANRFAIENPESFTTETREVFIRIAVEDLDCFAVVALEVLIYDNPQLTSISDYINCEIDTNVTTGFFFVTKDFEVINGQEGMQVLYFETENDAINRANIIDKNLAYQNTSNPQTVYVRLENEAENSCFAVAPMQIEVRQAPIYVEPTDMFRCDYNGNGLNTVNLSEKVDEITNGATQNLDVSFHLTPLNADLGTNALPLNYTTTANPQLIHARVLNTDTGCHEVSSFNITTLDLPEVNQGQSLTVCGNNYEFEQQWNLKEIELLILEGRQYGIEFTYFESEADLQNNLNSITNPEAYVNTSNPQTLYVKVLNVSTTCFASVPFELIINSPPEIDPIDTYEVCANAENYVDLSDFDLALLEDTFNVLVSYHTSEADAEANVAELNTDYTYTNTVENLFARVAYSTTGCYSVHPFQLVINPLPVANQPNDLVACDDDYDGLLEFDLSSQDSAVLGNQNPNEYAVSYFSSENEATENINELDVEHTAFDGEVIFVRIENLATGCFDITQFSVVVNPLPDTVVEDQVLCLNDLPLTVSADTGNPLDTYLWSTNETSSEIEITEVGSYAVTITNQYGCQSTSTFNITESESAVIDVVETIDFSDPNNITVTVNGIGDYLYQLNDLPFQTSNVFVNVPIGYNTITIIDQNGCARITREVLVFDAPKHLTPNDDGDFDTWHIAGVQELPGTRVHIFDRYGKLLKEIGHNTSGWDGTFNGNQMPSGDYWYIAYVIKDGESFQVKGHFALKR